MTERAIGVHHTGITVSDLQRSVEFYKRFGFEVEVRLESVGPDVGKGTGVPGAHLRVAMLLRESTRLELLEYLSPDGAPTVLPNNGIGAAHIAIQVDDIDAAVTDLIAAGIRFVSEPIAHESGTRWVYMKDPDGITTELFQVLRDPS